MHHKISKDRQKGIVTLMVIFGVGLFALATALTLAVSAATELAKNRNTVMGDQATYHAEAAADFGASQCLNTLKSIPSPGDSKTIPCTVGTSSIVLNDGLHGDQQATITLARDPSPCNPNCLPYVLVTGASSYGQLTRNIVQTISWFPQGEAFLHAITAQGDVDLQGTSSIDGDVYSHGTVDISGSASVNGAIQDKNSDLLLPEINFQPYEGLAVPSTGKTYLTAKDAEKDLQGKSKDQIFYVSDPTTVNLGNSTDLNGTLVTDGSLKLTGGNYTFSNTKYPVLIVGGDLELGGGVQIKGLVYVCGIVKKSAGGGNEDINITGSIVILGRVANELNYHCNPTSTTTTNDFGGHFNLTYDSSVTDAWQNLLGFDLTSFDPTKLRIVKWQEK